MLRGRERPPPAFWLITGVGAAAAIASASAQSGGIGQLHRSDLLLFGAVVAAAVGYAEGGLLARELGAWHTVSWALVPASPLMVFLAALPMPQQPPSGTALQWAAFAYLGVCWAGRLLGEQLAWRIIVGGVAVILCAGLAVRTRLSAAPSNRPQ